MPLFRPYEQGSSKPATDTAERGGASVAPRPRKRPTVTPVEREEPVAPVDVAPEASSPASASRQPQKKGRPTPTRAEAEAARMARLHPTLSPKEQKKADREADRQLRLQRLDAVENSPERRLVRDYVDARPALVGWVLPAMLLLMAITWVQPTNVALVTTATYLTMALLIGFVLSIWWAWRGWKKEADARGLTGSRRGLAMYLMNRMMTMRSMRRPEPRIKRGDSY